MEDIIEEVFWDIKDESDQKIEEIKKIWNGDYIVHSHVLINELLDLFELKFKDIWLDERDLGWETVSYLVTEILERFPSPWEKINFNIDSENGEKRKLIIKVQNISNFKIEKIEAYIKKES
jgi:CBS domain containing-hemolysin-like protein